MEEACTARSTAGGQEEAAEGRWVREGAAEEKVFAEIHLLIVGHVIQRRY